MNRVFVIFIVLIFVFGCVGSDQSKVTEGLANTTQSKVDLPFAVPNIFNSSPVAVSEQNCSIYCNSLPHIQCVGSWNYSGSQPNCLCSFNCASSSLENVTKPPQQTLPDLINLTPSELVNNSIEKLRNSFFIENSGTFTEHVYQWKINSQEVPSESSVSQSTISFGTEYMDVAFNNQTDKNLKASGFITFEDADELKSIRGVAVFRSKSSVLDDYVTFDVWYRQPLIQKTLLNCFVYSKDNTLLVSGQHAVYYFECGKISK